MTDLEIARTVPRQKIVEVAKTLGLTEDNLILYGMDKAKVIKKQGKQKGKLILVTAISPTPMGEGKTTVSIGLADGLKQLGKKVSLSLREPSLGPVFGMKGGATGGGYSQVVPMEDINLHFTGDFHAITSCNNLISAAIYNHIYQGNALHIQTVVHRSCLDINDRSLRKVKVTVRDLEFQTSFQITSASSIMALFCLAEDAVDLRKRLARMIVAYNAKKEPLTVHDFQLEGALMVLLKDAFYPNLVSTLEGTPAFVHGGPFANIAHGCSSVVATKLSLSLSDYTVTEAGFGADLGAEKFMNIVCPSAKLHPQAIVLVVTIKALLYHGNGCLTDGFANLEAHLDHLSHYQIPIIVCLNRFKEDKDESILQLQQWVEEKGYAFSSCNAYQDGGKGAMHLAQTVIDKTSLERQFQPLYSWELSLREKLETLAKVVYHASQITYSEEAEQILTELEQTPYQKLPICVSKTQYSISDNPKKLGYPKDNTLFVKDIHLESGASFVTFMLGDIYAMPGLPKHPNYERIDLVDGEIQGLF